MAEAFTAQLEKILQLDKGELLPDSPINAADWDSLETLAAIALIDREFGVAVTPEALAGYQTLGSLLAGLRAEAKAADMEP